MAFQFISIILTPSDSFYYKNFLGVKHCIVHAHVCFKLFDALPEIVFISQELRDDILDFRGCYKGEVTIIVIQNIQILSGEACYNTRMRPQKCDKSHV